MFMKDRQSGNLVEVLGLSDLFDPFQKKVAGRFHAGEEMADPANFAKTELGFPSGEDLPRCWVDPDYRQS